METIIILIIVAFFFKSSLAVIKGTIEHIIKGIDKEVRDAFPLQEEDKQK